MERLLAHVSMPLASSSLITSSSSRHARRGAVLGPGFHGDVEDWISIHAMELRDMVMPSYMLVVVCGEQPTGENDCVSSRGDDAVAVQWVRRCPGGK